MDALDHRRDSLWLLTIAPAIWAAHFGASYGLAALWCAKVAGRDGSLSGARLIVAGLTAVALLCIAAVGRAGWRAAALHTGATPFHADTATDRHRLLGLATFLLAILSGVAVIYTAIPVAIFRSCE